MSTVATLPSDSHTGTVALPARTAPRCPAAATETRPELGTPLSTWLRSEAGFVRLSGHIGLEERRQWLARQLEQLASTAEFLSADNPADFDDRLELAEASLRVRVARWQAEQLA